MLGSFSHCYYFFQKYVIYCDQKLFMTEGQQNLGMRRANIFSVYLLQVFLVKINGHFVTVCLSVLMPVCVSVLSVLVRFGLSVRQKYLLRSSLSVGFDTLPVPFFEKEFFAGLTIFKSYQIVRICT